MESKYTKEILETAVKEVTTLSDLVRLLTNSEKAHGSMIAFIKKRMITLNVDFSHFNGKNPKQKLTCKKLTKELFISVYLIESPIKKPSNTSLKNWIKEFNLMEFKCFICENVGEWMGKPISLQLDHINGVNNDNRIENLRILCPNCHSQTETYAGKAKKKNKL
jgi:5-methylcytosine-specific restriction endonuclease McrA